MNEVINKLKNEVYNKGWRNHKVLNIYLLLLKQMEINTIFIFSFSKFMKGDDLVNNRYKLQVLEDKKVMF